MAVSMALQNATFTGEVGFTPSVQSGRRVTFDILLGQGTVPPCPRPTRALRTECVIRRTEAIVLNRRVFLWTQFSGEFPRLLSAIRVHSN